MGAPSAAGDDELERLLTAGGLAYRAGRLEAARAAYEAAAARAPDDHRAHFSLASLDVRRGRLGAARARLARVVRLAPQDLAGWRNLAGVCRELGLVAESAQALRRVVMLAPLDPEPRFALAGDLFALGRGAGAIRAWRELAQDPAQRLRALSRLGIAAPHELGAAEVEEIAGAAAPENVAIALSFALGMAREAQGRHAEAFAAFDRANRMQRAVFMRAPPGRRPPDLLAAHLAAAERVRSLMTRERLSRANASPSGVRPIFVVGMPRSGSSLVERILGAHRDVQALGESGVLPRLLERAYPEDARGAFEPPLATLAEAYLDGLRERGWDGVRRPLDKTLENRLHVGVIRLMFPDAVIIESAREALDVCLGCWRQPFAQGGETLCDFHDIAVEYRACVDLMAHWRQVGAGVVEAPLEATIAAPEASTRFLVTQAAGLPWDAACASYWRTPAVVRTASAGQAQGPVSASALRRSDLYARWLGPLIKALKGAPPMS